MITLVNTWNREFALYCLLRTIGNYRETKSVFKNDFSVSKLEKISAKDEGKIEKGFEILLSHEWLTINNGQLTLSERLVESEFFSLFEGSLKYKLTALSDLKGVDFLNTYLTKNELNVTISPFNGLYFAPVFHYLSQLKEGVLNKFIQAKKNVKLKEILLENDFLSSENDGLTWTESGEQILEIYQKTSSVDLIEEIADAFLRKVTNSKKELLISQLLNRVDQAAENQYFYENKNANETTESNGLPNILFRDLQKRPYGLRRTQASDIAILTSLETLCWPKGLEISGDKLINRISRFPDGQWSAIYEDQVVGALYSQRIKDHNELLTCHMDVVEDLFHAHGDTIQLLAVNVNPDVQDLQIGGGLLEYVLQRVPLVKGVEKVVGVTRCRSYQKYASEKYNDYIRLRSENGGLIDPVLRYHERHGGEIVQPIPNYRVRDPENDGFGVLVQYDIYNRIRKDFKLVKDQTVSAKPVSELVEETIAKLLGDSFEDRYSLDLPLMEIGLDSSDLMVLRETLETALEEKISASFFFENSTAELVIEALADKVPASVVTKTEIQEPEEEETPFQETEIADNDVAVIGYSFKFPGASNVEELWEILANKQSSIKDLPEDRFEWPDWVDLNGEHKSINRGGFMDGIKEFDASFFRITPAEAELMDPQQRIMLELCWEAIEKAGYKANTLKGTKTGVFLGASGSDYELLMRDNSSKELLTGTGTALALLPNRLSYFFDLNGPSLQVDTACSSSLVAINEAVKAIKMGECSTAIVGAVNLICHPQKSLSYHNSQMLSVDGLCQTFDEKANGYVRGEGAAIMWLKPLKQAVADGDQIKGVIKGTAINHGGQAGGLTVPNPRKQKQLIETAYENAGIDIHAVSYLEAHGTGTGLGDPIEIDGLKNAFNSLKKSDFSVESCGLGSIKTNIGHLEAAAGMAGMVKLMLAMEKEQLPPTNNFTRLNPKIDLADSPFFIQTKQQKWKPAKGFSNLIAGISSFGIGGANGHVVVQNFKQKVKTPTYDKKKAALITLSAKSADRLEAYAEKLLGFVNNYSELDVYSMAYSFQTGREEMDERLAIACQDLSQLKEQLKNFLEGNKPAYRNRVKAGKKFALSAEQQKTIKKGNAEEVAQIWVSGGKIDWNNLYSSKEKPVKINLPTYPFAKDEFWLPVTKKLSGNSQKTVLHPLVHENTSDLTAQKFESNFSGNEYFLKDHVISGVKMLPGVAYAEIARKAGELSFSQPINRISDLTWINPVVLENEAVKITTRITPQESEDQFQVYSVQGENQVIHGQGFLSHVTLENLSDRNVQSLKESLPLTVKGSDFYAKLSQGGFQYGKTFQGVKEVYYNDDEALAQIDTISKHADQILSPEILDCALQTCMMMIGMEGNMMLPYSVKQINIYSQLTPKAYCYVKPAKNADHNSKLRSFDIEIFNEDGKILATINEFVAIPSQTKKSVAKTNVYDLKWKNRDLKANKLTEGKRVVLLTAGTKTLAKELSKSLNAEVEIINQLNPEGFFINVFEKVQGYLNEKEQVNLITVYQNSDQLSHALVSGLFKTLKQESHRVSGTTVGVEDISKTKDLASLIEEAFNSQEIEIRRNGSNWEVRTPEVINEIGAEKISFAGNYLITGGAGGIGKMITSDILSNSDSRVILLGRRKESEVLLEKHDRVSYYQTDISNLKDLQKTFKIIKKEHGAINGIYHSAGVIADDFIQKKTKEQIQKVFAPKITGTANLDEVTKSESLDFFVLFSSLSGLMGNAGQSDYAAANTYLDHFSEYRNNLVAEGKRKGKSSSINWPLWQDGGMQVDAVSERYLLENWGSRTLPSKEGILSLNNIISKGISNAVVTHEDSNEFLLKYNAEEIETQKEISVEFSGDIDKEAYLFIRKILSEELKLSEEKFQGDAHFETYGIDSILINKLTNRLDTIFGKLPRTLFFEYQTLEELAEYFAEEHAETISKNLQQDQTLVESEEKELIVPALTGNRFLSSKNVMVEQQPNKVEAEEIAIIGLSGKFPGADNIDEFWENLKTGKDSITLVPKDRWDAEALYDPQIGAEGKIYSKWGGFVNDIDKFDPVFFKISPREAELLDPQERLFLETSWAAIEDAGYTKELLHGKKKKGELGAKVGVFAGVMYEEYQLFGAEETLKGNPMAMWTNPSGIANRVSYFFDFHGPSMAVDTMCSSSLTAIHLACESLKRGETNYCIAGGVNITVHPNKYRMLSNGRFISAAGRCESFGEGGEGYVPSEGVGAVLLKPLSQAKADGDRIYGVVKATSLNHGGKTNGYTVPNPNAQAEVIKSTIKKAGVKAEDFSYLEAHGTGTSLGDPIEILGLSKAFGTKEKQYCAIGSVKSNIGHGESAAGISGLAKVLLQLKYKQLVPSLHSDTLNKNIDFTNSPFIVNQKLTDWKNHIDTPRISGISSFGAGGSNAHIIIEEFENTVSQGSQITDDAVILLTAKNSSRLTDVVTNLLRFLKSDQEVALHDLALTLQQGREHMDERMVAIVSDKAQLIKKLEAYLSGDNKGWLTGNTKKSTPKTASGEVLQLFLNKSFDQIAELWISGTRIDWTFNYADLKPKRISLPTYPFLRKRFWYDNHLDRSNEVEIPQQTAKPIAANGKISIKLADVDSPKVIEKPIENMPKTVKKALQPIEAVNQNGKISIKLVNLSDFERSQKPDWSNYKLSFNLSDVNQKPTVTSKVTDTIDELISETGVVRSEGASAVIDVLRNMLAKSLYLEVDEIDEEEKFIDLGLDSVVGVEWVSQINDYFKVDVEAARLYDYPTLALLSAYVSQFVKSAPAQIAKVENKTTGIQSAKVSFEEISDQLKSTLAKALYLEVAEIDEDEKFIDLGLDSVVGVEFISTINQHFKVEIEAARLYDYPTVNQLGKYIDSLTAIAGEEEDTYQVEIENIPSQNVIQIDSEEVSNVLKTMLSKALYLEENEIDEDEKFIDLGLDSVVGVELVSSINQHFKIEMEAARLYDYPSVNLLGNYITSLNKETISVSTPGTDALDDGPFMVSLPATKPRKEVTSNKLDQNTINRELKSMLSKALYLEEDEIDEDEKFIDLGLDSVVGVEFVSNINQRFHIEVEAARLYDYPTVNQLGNYINGLLVEYDTSSVEVQDDGPFMVSLPSTKPKKEVMSPKLDQNTINQELKTMLSKALYLEEDEIDEDEKFIDLGLDSVVGVEFVSNINKHFSIEIEAARLYDYPTVNQLGSFINTLSTENNTVSHVSEKPGTTSQTLVSPKEIISNKVEELGSRTLTLEQQLEELLGRVASGNLSIEEADKRIIELLD